MTEHGWKWWLVGIVWMASLAVQAAPTADEIAKAIRQLGDDDFQVREKASKFLWTAGKHAEAALQKAAQSEDVEVARRARALLEKFKYGIYADTPADIVKLIQEYRNGDHGAKEKVLRELLKKGKGMLGTVQKLVATEEDEGVRSHYAEVIARETSNLAALMLGEGNYAAAEELLELTLAGKQGATYRNYAAYQKLRGRLDDKIRHIQSERAGDHSAWELLCYMQRAKGDLAQARLAAEKAVLLAAARLESEKDNDAAARLTVEKQAYEQVLLSVLFELGDWKALIPLLERRGGKGEHHGALAAFKRLTGNAAGARAELEKAVGTDDAANAFLFNDRAKEGIDLLVKHNRHVRAFELLTLQLKFKQAFALADQVKELSAEDLSSLELLKAKTQYQLGDVEAARKVFARLAEDANQVRKKYGSIGRALNLLETEYQLGLKDLVFDHCARILASTNMQADEGPALERSLLDQVFPRYGTSAEVWWRFFRGKNAAEDATARMKRIRDLLEDHKAGKDFPALARDFEARAREVPKEQLEGWLTALADTCEGVGDEALTLTYRDKVAREICSAAAWLRLGDFHWEKKRWQEAADCYARSWEKDRGQAVPLYLLGQALIKAGKEKEGRTLTERAHCLPLGDEVARYHLAEELSKHGLTDDSRRQVEMILVTGEFMSIPVTNARNKRGEEAAWRKDHAQAVAHQERVLLSVLMANLQFVKSRAYLVVPFAVHFQKARMLAAAGQVDDALKEADLARDLLPGDIELAIHLLPDLEKHGRKKEAADFFQKTLDVHAKLCADYANSAWCHNNLAWLAARCRRRLDLALEHGTKAVALAPNNAGHLDTLAEVCFQRGDKNKALELMKKCLALDPKNEYFRKQLKRFEAGDPKTEPPNESDA